MSCHCQDLPRQAKFVRVRQAVQSRRKEGLTGISIMAASHVSVRLLTILAFSTFLLRSRSTDRNQGPVKANTQIVLPSVCFIRRQSCANRVKFPIVEWSKHGRTVIALPEIKQPTGVNIILLCGDIHPQPGPLISNSNTREERTVRHSKSTRLKTYATVAHLKGIARKLPSHYADDILE